MITVVIGDMYELDGGYPVEIDDGIYTRTAQVVLNIEGRRTNIGMLRQRVYDGKYDFIPDSSSLAQEREYGVGFDSTIDVQNWLERSLNARKLLLWAYSRGLMTARR